MSGSWQCRKCMLPANYLCGELCGTAYCSQQCGDKHYGKHKNECLIGASWDDLPVEMIVDVLDSLSIYDIERLAQTSAQVRDIVKDREWRMRYLRDKNLLAASASTQRLIVDGKNVAALRRWVPMFPNTVRVRMMFVNAANPLGKTPVGIHICTVLLRMVPFDEWEYSDEEDDDEDQQGAYASNWNYQLDGAILYGKTLVVHCMMLPQFRPANFDVSRHFARLKHSQRRFPDVVTTYVDSYMNSASENDVANLWRMFFDIRRGELLRSELGFEILKKLPSAPVYQRGVILHWISIDAAYIPALLWLWEHNDYYKYDTNDLGYLAKLCIRQNASWLLQELVQKSSDVKNAVLNRLDEFTELLLDKDPTKQSELSMMYAFCNQFINDINVRKYGDDIMRYAIRSTVYSSIPRMLLSRCDYEPDIDSLLRLARQYNSENTISLLEQRRPRF